MDKRKLSVFFKKLLSTWVSLLILSLVALISFIIGEVLQNILLQGLAGVLGGVALSLAITIITSREAVRQQNAKEANNERKNLYYIPVFHELKEIVDRLEAGKQKQLPYPQWIKGMGNEPQTVIRGNYPMPVFTTWATFQEEPYRSNFTEKACTLFDAAQKAGAAYNQAVKEAKDPVITMLNPKLDAALQEWAKSGDYKQWNEETKGGGTWSSEPYHQWNSYIFRYLQRPAPTEPEAQAFVWAFNMLGWILVDDIDKACDLMQKTYRMDFATYITPDSSWFKAILESVWIELQELDCIKATRAAAGELLVKSLQAKAYMQDRLNYIRDMYEGGEPPL